MRNFMEAKLYKYSAFTLAEVLITLGIIGVVAAITLPALINKYQTAQYETGVKRTYAIVTNGFRTLIAQEGSELNNIGIFVDDESVYNEKLDEAVRKIFKVIKTCKTGDTVNCPGYDVKYIKSPTGKVKHDFDAGTYFIVYLNDGTILRIENYKCETTPESSICAWILADINGEKGPNTFGKDVFALSRLTPRGTLYPDASLEFVKATNAEILYWRNNAEQCGNPDKKISESNTDEISGQNCLARIIENNWKIDYLD